MAARDIPIIGSLFGPAEIERLPAYVPPPAFSDIYRRAVEAEEEARRRKAPQEVVGGNVGVTEQDLPPEARAYRSDPVQGYTTERTTDVGDVPIEHPNVAVWADNLGDAELARDVSTRQTSLDPAANALREEQLSAIGELRNAPSSAQAMYQSALAKLARQQLGVASAARGSERAGARREAMLAIGAEGLEAADRAADRAAQENLSKATAIQGALANVRAGDIETATTNARLAQEANVLDAQIAAETARGNAAAVNALRQRRAELNLDASKSTALNALAAAKMRADVGAGNLDREQSRSQFDAGQQNTAARFAAEAANAANEAYAGRRTQIGDENANRLARALENRAAAWNQAKLESSRQALEGNKFNVESKLRSSAQSDAAREAAAGRQFGVMQEHGLNARSDRATEAARHQANAEAKGEFNKALLTGLATAAIMSDERVKRDVHEVSPRELLELADSLRAVTFRYKNGEGSDGGKARHAGVMAQDLERSKLGRTLVSKDSRGVRSVDYAGLAALMAAAAAPALRKAAQRG